MRVFLLVVMAVFTVTTITMVVANRGSEKIVTTFLLGLVATFSALMVLFFYGADEPIHKAFSSVVMVEAANLLPFEVLGFTSIPMRNLILTRDEIKAHSELRETTDSNGSSLYHHALQRAIISWFELKYAGNWEVDLLPYTFGEARGYFSTSKLGSSRIYKQPELVKLLQGNKFADLQSPFGPNLGLALPPQTRLKVTAPHHDPQLGEIGAITISNRYCEFVIQTRYAAGQRGIGSYAAIVGLSEVENNRLWTNQYTIIINASFQRFLTGSPDMPRYKKWAADVVAGLRKQFDEQELWTELRDYYLLHKTFPRGSR